MDWVPDNQPVWSILGALAPRRLAPAAIRAAAGVLSAAHRPVLVAAGGSHRAAAELAELLERGVPVITTGKGVVDGRHPLALGGDSRSPRDAGWWNGRTSCSSSGQTSGKATTGGP